eukprot:6472110-Amphidinium_carterae.2
MYSNTGPSEDLCPEGVDAPSGNSSCEIEHGGMVLFSTLVCFGCYFHATYRIEIRMPGLKPTVV